MLDAGTHGPAARGSAPDRGRPLTAAYRAALEHSVMRATLPSLLVALVVSLGTAFAPALASAQAPQDRVAFGGDVYVGPGEVVADAVSFGGNVTVEGTVRGDAVAFGGDVVRQGGTVEGEIVTMGGFSRTEPAPFATPETPETPETPTPPAASRHADGPLDDAIGWVKSTARSAVAHVLLFLLGLLFLGVSRERLAALQVTMIKDSLRTAGWGLLGYVGAAVTLVLLCVTIIGIPVALVGALALPVLTYLGLAAAATVIGAALPIAQLKGREIAQLGAGVLILFVASIVPFIGGIATAVAACLGFGALLRTRLSERPPVDLPGGPLGDAGAAPAAS